MARSSFALALVMTGLLGTAAALPGQVVDVALTRRGRPVPLHTTREMTRLGRTLAHGLLATAHQDVTRPVSDTDLAALGRRGTLLRVRLAAPEPVVLLRLGVRDRPSRLAAYVPPGRHDRAFVFLGRSRWHRIVVVDLPDTVRDALRRLEAMDPRPTR